MAALVFSYLCDHCGQSFDRRVEVDLRDDFQACEFCGNGAKRLFNPAAVGIVCSWTFNACMISDVAQSYEQAKAQDAENERYLASKPKEKPGFEQCVKDALDERGYRRPHRLIEP